MGPMRRMFLLLFPLMTWLTACSPAWNWREIRLEGAPLTVVLPGDVAPYRGERLFVGLQNARLYNGNQRIEPREDIALAESA